MIFVAPLVGAWIEISYSLSLLRLFSVAPLVGAWIEICVRLTYIVRWLVAPLVGDRKSTRLNSSHVKISYAVFCLKKKKTRLQHEYR